MNNENSYAISMPCLLRTTRIRRRTCSGSCIQGILIIVLIVTLIFNIMFILDNRTRLRATTNANNNNDEYIDKNNGLIDENRHVNFDRNADLKKRVDLKSNSFSGKKIKVEAKSSKSTVYISIDGLKVYENSIEEESARGIHVIVLNEVTGVIMAKRIFDTYLAKEDEAMVLFLNMLQEGRIVVFMCKDECSANLKKAGRNALKMFGSRFINSLGWRDSWALISKKRDIWLAESHQKAAALDQWGSPLIIESTIELQKDGQRCHWGSDEIAMRRKQFCQKYEGYGTVCSCTNPAPIDLHGPPLLGSRVASLPIAVIAANRPHYLYRMLRGLLTTPGVDRKMVTVYIDGFFDEPSAVAELFQVAVVEHTPICSKNCRISQHYKRTLHETFEKYPSSEFMIILEEDLDVSRDIMDYFSQLLPALQSDESVYCISAWNDQGYEHSCNDPSQLYRIETMPGLGWVLKKKLFKEELEPNWPGSDKFWDWDMWMRLDGNRKGRECIIPDVSRTYHFGAKGLNMNSFFQELYFNKHALNTITGIKFDVEGITKDKYDEGLHQLIKQAEIVDHTKNPCTSDDFIPNTKGRTYAIYMKQDRDKDYETWNSLAKCFKLWDLDVRGFHKQVWRFWLKENRIVVVGMSSPFAKYKPGNVTPIFIPKKKKDE